MPVESLLLDEIHLTVSHRAAIEGGHYCAVMEIDFMPEFVVASKYKQLFNDYDLSVIKADHYFPEREDLHLYRNAFLERIKQRYPNRRWLLPPVLETISKIEGLSDAEFVELMKTFRYV